MPSSKPQSLTKKTPQTKYHLGREHIPKTSDFTYTHVQSEARVSPVLVYDVESSLAELIDAPGHPPPRSVAYTPADPTPPHGDLGFSEEVTVAKSRRSLFLAATSRFCFVTPLFGNIVPVGTLI